jgi:uncharacterized protein YcbK (DUF882 family)
MATRNFTDDELRCQCGCYTLNPDPSFTVLMNKVQYLRDLYGKSIVVTSAYRCPQHPIEICKKSAGQHSIAAIDLSVSHKDAHDVLRLAFMLGFTGIGVNQKGNGRFIHLDLREKHTVWSY